MKRIDAIRLMKILQRVDFNLWKCNLFFILLYFYQYSWQSLRESFRKSPISFLSLKSILMVIDRKTFRRENVLLSHLTKKMPLFWTHSQIGSWFSPLFSFCWYCRTKILRNGMTTKEHWTSHYAMVVKSTNPIFFNRLKH